VADDCAECHKTAAVSAKHEPVESLSVEACIECHESKQGDAFLEAVHTSHLDEGFECVDCHGEDGPPREELDVLLDETDR
jgi:Doubled CXXCH motif (Paired_CXXCH_1)